MQLREELVIMQKNYDKKRLKDIRIKRPKWLEDDDPMAMIYQDKTVLLEKGELVLACIVQANEILFDFFPHVDCPANIIYSNSPAVMENPVILRNLAYDIFRYKNKPLESVPEEWREVARVITDEYDRSDFTFTLEYNGEPIKVHFIPLMIFRKLLPKRILHGSFLPVLTVPECKTVMVLPKRYWTKDFRKAWCNHLI